jgi:septin family protein
MGSPESLKLKPRIVSLNIMVAGLAGLGKTTLCRALLDAWWEEIQEEKGDSVGTKRGNPVKERLGAIASSLSSSFSSGSLATKKLSASGRTTISTTSISPSAPFEYFDEKANTILRVRIIDTPGFGNRVNHRNSVKPITDYISDCRRKRFRREQSPSSHIHGDEDANNRILVHVCLYFLSPGRFLAIDRHFLKHVQNEVTIVPVIAKADTMTDDEIARYRAELAKIWDDESIDVYSLDDKTEGKRGFGSSTKRLPNPVNGSPNYKFYRGRRPGEVLAIVSRDGIYPWGHTCAMDPEHSDLKLIRDSLLSEHTERFLELATTKYVAFRDAQIARQSRSGVLKYVALVGLAALQLGQLEIRGTTLKAVVGKGFSVIAPFLKPRPKARLAVDAADPKDAGSDDTADSKPKGDKKKKGFRLFAKASSSDSTNGYTELGNVVSESSLSIKKPSSRRGVYFGLFGKRS